MLVQVENFHSSFCFSSKSFTLNDEQLRFIIESTERCFRLLRETHPKGPHFADSIKVRCHYFKLQKIYYKGRENYFSMFR